MLGRQSARRFEVVPERLLHDDASLSRESGLGEIFHDSAEEEGRDLQVEDRTLSPLDRGSDALVGVSLGEVTTHVRKPCRELTEHCFVDLLAGADNRLPRTLDAVSYTHLRAHETDSYL